jgi:hypothetical protein
MAKDLFDGGAPPINGHSYDLFSGAQIDTFRWAVAIFAQDGASQIIPRTNAIPLATFYPIRWDRHGAPVPLWRNYLFVEFKEAVTIDLCRTTTKFVKIINAKDQDGIVRPILVRRDSIAESLRLVTMGKFNEVEFKRKFYGRGSIVRVIEGSFIDRTVRLEIDVPPDMNARTRVPVDMNGIKAKIELFKLAL